MKLDLSDIFETQSILDKTIHLKHNVNYASVYEELKLALMVELGELANEVRCFKFWSIKGASSKEIIIEEYVDGIHFITAMAISKKIQVTFDLPDDIIMLNKQDLTKAFNHLFLKMNTLDDANGVKEWFYEYLILGYYLGFSYKEIHKAYFEKNQINFRRQKDNY